MISDLIQPDKWEIKKLDDMAHLHYGKGLRSDKRKTGCIPVYSSAGITGFHNTPLVNEPGIIVGRKGTVGSVFLSEKPFYCIDTAYYIKKSEVQCDFKFLYYLLKTLGLENMNQDSAVPGLNRDHAHSLSVNIPNDITEQKRIASILSTLDKKIELNRKTNQTLEEMAQAIFKEWFVDFNYPGATGEMVDSELGPIPKGWRVSCLGDEGEFKNGINYSRNDPGDHAFSIVNVRNIVKNRFVMISDLDKIIIDKKKAAPYKLTSQDILLTRSASPGEAAILYEPTNDTIFSGFTIRYRINTTEHVLFLFLLLHLMKERLADLANGTTLKSINQASLKNVHIAIPDKKTLGEFSAIISSIYDDIYRNQMESELLCKIRDLILPELMNNSLDLG